VLWFAVQRGSPATRGTMLRHSWFEWSSWGFGLLAVIYIVVSERRLARERRRVRRIAGEVEPSGDDHVRGSTLRSGPGALGHGQERFDDRLRSVLIQVAVDALPFSLAVDRSRRFDATRTEVEDAARVLQTSKLLRFTEPLGDSTTIRLN
jgi:hypothetical protein